MNNLKISGGQAVLLLFLSRAFNVLNYVPLFNKSIEGTAMLYGTLIAFLLSLVLFVPPILLFKRFNGENIIDLLFKKCRPLGYVFSFVIFACTLLSLIGTVGGFEFFMTNAVYLDALIGVISVTMVISCLISSFQGLEGIARAAVIVFAFFLVGTVFIFIAAVPSIELLNIRPVISEPVKSAFSYAFGLISKSHEFILLILLFPNIKGSVAKASVKFLTLSFGFIALANFLIISVLGDFFKSQTFPYYSLTSVIEVSVLQRLDSIHMTLWVFVSFIRITLFIIFSDIYLKNIIPKKLAKFSMPFIFTTALSVAILALNKPSIADEISPQFPIIITVFLFVLPIILLVFCRNKGGAEGEKIKENETVITASDGS